MGDRSSLKKTKLSWPKKLIKKWLNIKSKTNDFHADLYRGEGGERRNKHVLDSAFVKHVHNLRVFTATWNVAGQSPPSHLNLEDWLHIQPPSDIYVLGFQEIVPLNTGNVLGTEDNGPARKWVSLIRRTLNSLPEDSSGSCRTPCSSFYPRSSFQYQSKSLRMNDLDMSASVQPHPGRFSVSDTFLLGPDFYDHSFGFISSGVHDSASTSYDQHSTFSRSASFVTDETDKSKYCLVASDQMVGIFLTVWVKSDLRDSVKNLKVSRVERGLMGYLGNKGSVSISMSVHQTSFCFVCTHLTHGQKNGDELKRNSDVLEILRKTRFDKSPQTILEHDRVIWLGDLNYRIALSCRSVMAFVEMRDWSALLEKDQLRVEQGKGIVFQGWNEGTINFPPTYKYFSNSDVYVGDDRLPMAKKRTPAWCDRILWYGSGLSQLSYDRGESIFSDHRPVYSLFSVEIEEGEDSTFL